MTWLGESSTSGIMTFTEDGSPGVISLGVEGQFLGIVAGSPVFIEPSGFLLSSGVFGNNYIYVESNSESSTTSTSYQDKLILNIPAGLNNSYRIGWCGEVLGTKEKVMFVRVYNNTDGLTYSNPGFSPSEIQTSNNVWSPYSGFIDIEPAGSAKEIIIQWRSNSAGKTAKIRNTRVEFWRIE